MIDGDTIEIRSKSIRINGIDAPESRQRCIDRKGQNWRCGSAAAMALDGFLSASRPLRCEYIERDRYGRVVANCFRADGRSVGAWLVRNGHALDWPRYSKGAYSNEQEKAEAAKAGIWSGLFEAPWEWRARHRNPGRAGNKAVTKPSGVVASAECRIKANINADGEHIYHVPGQKAYKATRVTPDRGERWFCSEADAKAAGWRRARS